MTKYKPDVLEKIKSDPNLFSAVLNAINRESVIMKPGSLLQALIRQSKSISDYDIVILVASYLGMDPDDVIEKESTEEAQK